MLAGVAAKINVAELATIAARPAAVVPRSSNDVVQMLRVALLVQFISLDWPIEIFLVIPAGDVQVRHLRRAVDIARSRLPLPELVIAGVIDKVVPRGNPAMEILAVGAR